MLRESRTNRALLFPDIPVRQNKIEVVGAIGLLGYPEFALQAVRFTFHQSDLFIRAAMHEHYGLEPQSVVMLEIKNGKFVLAK